MHCRVTSRGSCRPDPEWNAEDDCQQHGKGQLVEVPHGLPPEPGEGDKGDHARGHQGGSATVDEVSDHTEEQDEAQPRNGEVGVAHGQQDPGLEGVPEGDGVVAEVDGEGFVDGSEGHPAERHDHRHGRRPGEVQRLLGLSGGREVRVVLLGGLGQQPGSHRRAVRQGGDAGHHEDVDPRLCGEVQEVEQIDGPSHQGHGGRSEEPAVAPGVPGSPSGDCDGGQEEHQPPTTGQVPPRHIALALVHEEFPNALMAPHPRVGYAEGGIPGLGQKETAHHHGPRGQEVRVAFPERRAFCVAGRLEPT